MVNISGNSGGKAMYDDCPEQERKTIEAKKLIADILNGNGVELNCGIVTGDLVLPRNIQISGPITITNSIIKGKVTFEEVHFNNGVNFSGTCFANDVRFVGATFRNCIFEGARFQEATFFSDTMKVPAHFLSQADFKRTIFDKYVDFSGVVFDHGAEFSCQNIRERTKNKSVFLGEALFNGAAFELLAQFGACEFQRVEFRQATFRMEAYFGDASFGGYTNFLETIFRSHADFNNAKFTSFKDGVAFGEAKFYGNFTDFRNVLFNGIHANFRDTQFMGEFVSFHNAKFRNLNDQEVACRKARKQLKSSENKDEEDLMFYIEMDAKRRQKGITKTLYPESLIRSELGRGGRSELGAISIREFIQYFGECIANHEWSKITVGFVRYNIMEKFLFQWIFGGYGIFWHRIAISWLLISILIGIGYWHFQGITEAPFLSQNVYFSFLVAFTRGNGGFHPNPKFEIIVAIEIVFGLIMFGIFIASITRKYMR
jgi:uncharacterized protein YjbI with pentapeptide repeats